MMAPKETDVTSSRKLRETMNHSKISDTVHRTDHLKSTNSRNSPASAGQSAAAVVRNPMKQIGWNNPDDPPFSSFPPSELDSQLY
mmetsp:Transcript_8676/g.11340  ORF Transcript_8676/g.11340 Transcript_8676/m.11340 type:complete len:85 (+) Transcript_8676:788-1042(+)